jgi:hypothetical protein
MVFKIPDLKKHELVSKFLKRGKEEVARGVAGELVDKFIRELKPEFLQDPRLAQVRKEIVCLIIENEKRKLAIETEWDIKEYGYYVEGRGKAA